MAFNPLALLLGQEAASALGMEEDPFMDPQTGENTMVVNGANRRPPVATPPIFGETPDRQRIDPRYVLNDDRVAPTSDEMKEILPRKGMFGVKGTLRDVLGALGDAFLVQGGADPMYSKRRERERQGDAMFGAAEDPMQAAERLAAAGYPEEAQKIIEQYQRNQYQQGVLKSQDDARKDLSADRRYTNVNQARTALQRIIVQGRTPEQRARLAATYGPLITKQAGATPEEIGLIPGLSDEDLVAWARGDMTVNQTSTLPLAQERVDIQRDTFEAKKDGGMFDRPPPRPGPQPRSMTELEYFQSIDRTPPSKRTQGQKDFYEKYTKGTSRRRRGGTTPPPASPNSRFKVTRVQ